MGQIIINDRAFYDLPRKFNIAYDGGGLIGTVEDTNDIGCKAVKVGDEIFFRIALGGATGHKALQPTSFESSTVPMSPPPS